ncbi:UNVERIFIED_CONTAM: hypothetical protein RMT77_010244 [Armadillidium vulgare]
MKAIVFACLLAVAIAFPDDRYAAPSQRGGGGGGGSADYPEILRDDRAHPEDGRYSFDIETEDGIKRSESGSPLDIDENPTGQQGSVSFTLPNGEEFNLKFVADGNGYQPESPFLPVAPEFPHPIPQFVLDQIEKAAREDAEEARSGGSKGSSQGGYQ